MQNATGMFQNGSGLTNLDLSAWDVSSIDSFTNMFVNCSNWNPSAIFTMANVVNTGLNTMFSGCSQFNLDLSSWDFTFAGGMTGFGLNWGMDTTNYDLLLGALAGQTLQTGLITTMSSSYTAGELATGNPTSIVPNSLVDIGANFVVDGVSIGDILYNETTDSYAEITSVTITTLGLDSDIFLVLTDTYSVQGSQAAKDRYVIINTYGWDLSDTGPI